MPRAPPLLTLANASFRASPTTRRVFRDVNFTLAAAAPPRTAKWSVIGPAKTAFLHVVRGSYVAEPPNSRLYPLLAARRKWPHAAFQLVAFGAGSSSAGGMLRGGTGGDGYLSARYETLREEFDLTLREWLAGAIEHANPFEAGAAAVDAAADAAESEALLAAVARSLLLDDLLDQAVMTLSNGQSRRARIAQALLKRPEALLVDEPFMGLDPPGKVLLSRLLGERAETQPVVLGLRLQDPVPGWISHVAFVEEDRLVFSGEKEKVVREMKARDIKVLLEGETSDEDQGIVEKVWAGVGSGEKAEPKQDDEREAIVEMHDVRIAYYDKVILEKFNWTIRRGDRWCLFGPNGSGKTTVTSLLTSDHPLTYSLPIKHFGRSRLPTPGQPGISVFDLQRRIAVASPELHAFFPRHLTLRRAVLSAFAETFLTPPKYTGEERAHVERCLQTFEDLVGGRDGWEREFGDVDLSTQRLVLFLRATVGRRELVVFDEAFSGMAREVRERCFAFLQQREVWDDTRQAMVVVSHVSEEVPPGMTKWVRLAEKGGKEGAVFGEF